MRIDRQLSIFIASLSALCAMSLVGCGGGGDSETASNAGESSAAIQAVENEVESRMGMEDGGAGGGHDSDGMGQDGYEDASYEDGGEPGMEPGMEGDLEMYEDAGSPYNQQPNRQNQVVSRPADVMQWTSEQVLAAVEEKDSAVLQAIQVQAAGSQGNPEFAQLMTQVLQTSSGHEVVGDNAGGTFGLPGLESLFGGGAASPAGGNDGKTLAKPMIVPGSLPPGGAFYRPQRITPSAVHGVDSLEMMIGEAVLAYVPQAVQGSRDAAQRIQGAASGHDADGAGMAAPAAGGASGHDAPSGQMGAPANSGHDASMTSGVPAGMDGMGGMDYESNAGMGYESGQPRPVGNLQDEELVRTVVRALVTNNTAPAWVTLKGIVNGDIASPLPLPLNTEIVLAEVFSSATPNVAFATELLTIVTGSVVKDPVGNQSTLRFLAALAQGPTDHFMMLAKPLAPAGANAGTLPPAGMNAMGVPGQPNSGMMGIDPGMDGNMSDDLNYEDGFGSPPGGLPPGPPPGSLPPVRVSEAGMPIVANILWNKSSIMTVAGQLQAADSPASVAGALALASTIPSDAVRHATYTLFSRSHEQGAAGMTSNGLFRDVARDPGLLTVLKSLPRSRAKKPASSGLNTPVLQASPEDSWVAATQEMVLSLRDRLRDVADDPNLAFDGQQPVRLHQGAVAERSIRIRVPGKMATELGESSPSSTTMYYSTCRVTPQRASEMQKVVDHYEKRSKGIKREVRSKGILWYDGVKVNEEGTRTSMDVIIQQVGFKPQRAGGPGYEGGGNYEGGGGAAGGPVQFTIEVVVVVTRDPKNPPVENAVSSR